MIKGHPVYLKGKAPIALPYGVPRQQPKPAAPTPQPQPQQPPPQAAQQPPQQPAQQPPPQEPVKKKSKYWGSDEPEAPAGKTEKKPSHEFWSSLFGHESKPGNWGDKPSDKPKAPPRAYSPDEQKLHHLARSVRKLGPLKRVAAGGVVFKNFDAAHPDDLEILVAKTHPKWGGQWVFPKGGADEGEHIHDTAAREVEEETGVKAKVIPGHEPFVHTSTFGERGKYDLPLVVSALKKAHPGEEEFIDKMKDHLANEEHFSYENQSHYYLMQHTGGTPITHPDQSHDQEMGEARFMPIWKAAKLGGRIGDTLKSLRPAIEKQMKAAQAGPTAGGGGGPARTESLYDRCFLANIFDYASKWKPIVNLPTSSSVNSTR